MTDAPPKRLFRVSELVRKISAVQELKRTDDLIKLLESLDAVAEIETAKAAPVKAFFIELGLDAPPAAVPDLTEGPTATLPDLEPTEQVNWCWPKA